LLQAARRLDFKVEPGEVALHVTKRWWGGRYEGGRLAAAGVMGALLWLLLGCFLYFTRESMTPGLFLVGFAGSLGVALILSTFLFSHRCFLITNRRIVDRGGIVGKAWMLPLAEIDSIEPFYVDVDGAGGGEGVVSHPAMGLKAVCLSPRAGEDHLISVEAYGVLVRHELVPKELRGSFPERLRGSVDKWPKTLHRQRPPWVS
jgi:hypothetical protein